MNVSCFSCVHCKYNNKSASKRVKIEFIWFYRERKQIQQSQMSEITSSLLEYFAASESIFDLYIK